MRLKEAFNVGFGLALLCLGILFGIADDRGMALLTLACGATSISLGLWDERR